MRCWIFDIVDKFQYGSGASYNFTDHQFCFFMCQIDDPFDVE